MNAPFRPLVIGHHLADLARRVRRLGPDRRDPEAFYVERSEIAHELARLARSPDCAALGARHAPAIASPVPLAVRTVVQRVEVVRTVALRQHLRRPPRRHRYPRPPRAGSLELAL